MQCSLTTTAQEVVRPDSASRRILFTGALFSTAVYIALRFTNAGPAEALLSVNGVTAIRLTVPAGVSVHAYTDAGTALLAVSKEKE